MLQVLFVIAITNRINKRDASCTVLQLPYIIKSSAGLAYPKIQKLHGGDQPFLLRSPIFFSFFCFNLQISTLASYRCEIIIIIIYYR